MGNGTAVHAYTDRRNPEHKQMYVHICKLTQKNTQTWTDVMLAYLDLHVNKRIFTHFLSWANLLFAPHSHLFNLYSVHVLSSLCLTLKVSMSPRLHVRVSQEFGHKTCLAVIEMDWYLGRGSKASIYTRSPISYTCLSFRESQGAGIDRSTGQEAGELPGQVNHRADI